MNNDHGPSAVVQQTTKLLNLSCRLICALLPWNACDVSPLAHTFSIDTPGGEMVASCHTRAFSFPDIFGAQEIAIRAEVVKDYRIPPEDLWPGEPIPDGPSIDFCNVSISYTHPGQGDVINTAVWLPLKSWNGRFQGAGGGGYITGMDKTIMFDAAASGFAVGSTDGGHQTQDFGDPYQWALISPGNVNLYLLQDFASVTLNETAWIGKAVTASFYKSPPKYSYHNGCSTGGRQGLMLAQRYPDAYNGILASAPAINWPAFIPAALYIRTITSTLGVKPSTCEYDALTKAAVSACDVKDGVVDGVISAPQLCDFDPYSLVGERIWCEAEQKNVQITEAAVLVAKTSWDGPKSSDGSFLWHGLTPDAPISGTLGAKEPIRNDSCAGISCIPDSWAKLWVYKDAKADITSLSHTEYERIFKRSVREYNSIIGTNDPDLTDFRDYGGKMITWHGLADASIVPGGTEEYYKRVLAHDLNAPDYYRYFEAPGVGHCFRGIGPQPKDVLERLMAWVERDEVPDTLDAESPPDEEELTYKRPLCLYPLVARYKGTGDIRAAENWECGEKLKLIP